MSHEVSWGGMQHAACFASPMNSLAQAYVCLENVARRETGTKVQTALHALGYLTQCIFANAANFGVPQSRTRLYVVGVLASKVRVLHQPDQWCVWLKDTKRGGGAKMDGSA